MEVDSVLRKRNINLSEKNDLLKAQIGECKTQLEMTNKLNALLEKDLTACEKKCKRYRIINKISLAANAVLSIVCITLIVLR